MLHIDSVIKKGIPLSNPKYHHIVTIDISHKKIRWGYNATVYYYAEGYQDITATVL